MGTELNSALEVLFQRVDELVSTKTVVGDALVLGDVTIVPLIEVSVGVGAGSKSKEESSAGGMGAKITPSAVLVVHKGNVQMMNMKNQDAVSKLIDMAPSVVSKLNFGSIFGKATEDAHEEKEDIPFEEEIITKE